MSPLEMQWMRKSVTDFDLKIKIKPSLIHNTNPFQAAENQSLEERMTRLCGGMCQLNLPSVRWKPQKGAWTVCQRYKGNGIHKSKMKNYNARIRNAGMLEAREDWLSRNTNSNFVSGFHDIHTVLHAVRSSTHKL